MIGLFQKTFPNYVLLCTLCGIYVPNPENNLKNWFFYCYVSFAATSVLIPTVDVAYAMLTYEIPTSIKFHLVSCGVCYFWGLIKIIYILHGYKNLKNIMDYWSTNFEIENFKQYRQDKITMTKRKLMKTMIYLFLVFCLPFAAIGVVKAFSGKLFIFSGFNKHFFSFDAPLYLSLIQFTGTTYLQISWLGFEVLFLLFLNLIKVELEYLHYFLHQSLDFKTNSNNDPSFKPEYLIKLWIKHHSQLIQISRKIKDFYSPMITGLYIYLILIFCTLLFSAVQGRISAENATYNSISNLSFIVAVYMTCSIGDEIEEKSMKLAEAAMVSDWINVSRETHQQLLMISIVCTKPITIDIYGYSPMNSQTLKQIVLMQYRFYTFIKNSMR